MINRRDVLKGAALGLAASSAPLQGQIKKVTTQVSSTEWQMVLPGIWKARIGVPEKYTHVSSRVIPPAKDGFTKLPQVAKPPIEKIGGEITSRGCRVQLPLKMNEQIYGFGLQLLSFAQRGKKKTIRVNADPRMDTGDSHAPVPFYVTTNGYGIFVDTCRQANFYCGNTHLHPRRKAAEASVAVPTPEDMPILPDAEDTVTIEIPRAEGVDIYLIGGPSMLDAVRRYNLFSGGGVEPPEWGLGFWYRAYGKADDAAVLKMAKELHEHNIPCDVLGLEPGWQSHAYSCSFRWDPVRFSHPDSFIAEMKRAGYKVNLWEHAFTHTSSPLFDQLQDCCGDYGVWGGLVPDFAGEAARKCFGDYHGSNLIDLGIAGFKLDECDSSDFTGGWSFPEFSKFPSGVDGEQMHQVFGLRYQDAIWQQFKDRNLQTYNMVRSSGALAAPYPFVLYSDLYGHKDYVRALVNSGFSGLLWCPEVRDASNDEDLIRRLETVMFSPIGTVNSWYIKNPPWKQIVRSKNNADQLMENWEALEERCRKVIGWRMQLIPYLRSAFAKYRQDGTPPFRALIMDYPDDETLRTVDDAYMMGDRMLVAPFFAGEVTRKVVLPKGTWHDFWTGEKVEGGGSLTVEAAGRNIPVYVKTNSIFPLAGIGLTVAEKTARELTVHMYGNGALAWRLEGESGIELSRPVVTGEIVIRSLGPKPHSYQVVGMKQF